MSDKKKAKQAPKFQGRDDSDNKVLMFSYSSRQEAEHAKLDRMKKNRANFDAFHLRGDFSHKRPGQSAEYIPRVSMSTEQLASFMRQAMIEAGDWFGIEMEAGVESPGIKKDEIQKIARKQLDKVPFDEFLEDSLKIGTLGALMIAKVSGQWVNKPRYFTEQKVGEGGRVEHDLKRADRMVWQLRLDLVRQEDFYPDPTGKGLYTMEEIDMDYHEVIKLAQGPRAIYDLEMVRACAVGVEDMDQDSKKARETGQNQPFGDGRKRMKLQEFWGTVIDPVTGEVLHENVKWTIANDCWLIERPKPYPFWHNQNPYVVCPITRVPKSVWHKALMDAPTALNEALNELFNLNLDTGIMATFGLKQIRPDWLENPEKYEQGVPPGETLVANSSCPPGGKVLETLHTAEMTPETMATYQTVNGEYNQAALTNDLRMGVLPSRQVKATEVVEASQTITSMFTGLALIIEHNYCLKIVEKAWLTIAQHLKYMDDKELEKLLGKDRAREILAMTQEQIFEASCEGLAFQVYGISKTLRKMKDFKKMTALLQTIGSSEAMLESFVARYDFGKLLEQIMRSLDIEVSKIEVTEEERAGMMGGGPLQPGSMGPGSTPDMQSQVPGVDSTNRQREGVSPVPQSDFPPSRATGSLQ